MPSCIAVVARAAGYCHAMIRLPAGPPVNQQQTYLVCRLAGALGLDRLCEQLVAGLASAAGVTSPAAGGTPAEAKQVAALEALVQVVVVDKLQVNACQILMTCCISVLDGRYWLAANDCF